MSENCLLQTYDTGCSVTEETRLPEPNVVREAVRCALIRATPAYAYSWPSPPLQDCHCATKKEQADSTSVNHQLPKSCTWLGLFIETTLHRASQT